MTDYKFSAAIGRGIALLIPMLASTVIALTICCLLCGTAAWADDSSWQAAGWGGGGYYWCAIFDPKQADTIYMGGDVDGVYKTEDLGQHWRLVNQGLSGYGVYGLAVSVKKPETIYADTTAGLNKSTDGGAHWLPLKEAIGLGIKGARDVTIRPIAVDPLDDDVVFAGTPDGKVCKSSDGGAHWTAVYTATSAIHSVTISPADGKTVLAATDKAGLVISRDSGNTWTPLNTPHQAACAAFATGDGRTIYGAFYDDGLYKSEDSGATWAALPTKGRIVDAVVSPANRNDVYAIQSAGWSGKFWCSHDAGKTWASREDIRYDREADATDSGVDHGAMSAITNLTISPVNPKLLFISANWRPAFSSNAGETWTESDRGADISVVYDIRFSNAKTYASVMDEGVFESGDDGGDWSQLWPLDSNTAAAGGHYWRLDVWNVGGIDHILSTCSPWDSSLTNRVVLSGDGGKTYTSSTNGLPGYNTHANTMWGQGDMRALAADPKNPNIIYAGIDGDPADGNQGGGVFKSIDAGATWSQLPNQPACRRMFFGLVVDPTDSQRIYWAGCGNGGGVYRSDDGGSSWKQIFSRESWVFNLAVSPSGILYVPGSNLWKSADHGDTWAQISNFNDSMQILGLAVSPTDDRTVWLSEVTWGDKAVGFIRKTTDGGSTWTDITGNIPYRAPLVLRYNAETHDLWAGGVGLWRIKQ
jgi:photosystem II stability/assembly factor-like uncharacterized protein